MDHLWAPWRSTYINEKKEERTGCIFCIAAAAQNDAEVLVVHRAQFCFVLLNRYPYISGHVMVAPYQHAPRLSAVTEETAAEMMQVARASEQILETAYKPHGLNMGLNLGEAAGAGFEQHIHLHILPRWWGDANFMTSVSGTRVLSEGLDVTYTKLKEGYAAKQRGD